LISDVSSISIVVKGIFSNTENLVLWAWPEIIRLPADRNRMSWSTGIMECWNTGFGGMRSIFIY
jgi:hypothetical protein